MHAISRYLYIVLCVTACMCCAPALADGLYFDAGVAAFGKGDYKSASEYMDLHIKEDPQDSMALYYLALSYQQLGDNQKYQNSIARVLKQFPKSKAATMAKAHLAEGTLPQTQPLKQTLNHVADLPRETWIPFTKVGRALVVDGRVNKHPMRMIFDTGAETCLLTVDHLKDLGIAPPEGKPHGLGAGVGNNKPVPVWIKPLDLSVGRIERKNFPVLISPIPMEYPLLGVKFFKGYDFTVDNKNDSILFKQKGGVAHTPTIAANSALTVDLAGNYVYNVPFTRQGETIIVSVTINGKPQQMIFDTGAEVCLFTSQQLKELGIDYNINSPQLMLRGLAGVTRASTCLLESMKLGPIDRKNVLCGITDDAFTSRPLLGQNFFQSWQFTIDDRNSVIRFTKK